MTIYYFGVKVKKKRCEVCGENFTPKNRTQIYCGSKCRRKAQIVQVMQFYLPKRKRVL